jgi:hypothetical protein
VSEQDAASVERYLDRRDDAQRDQADAAHRGRRARATAARWEYMVWETHLFARLSAVLGDEALRTRYKGQLFSHALEQAGQEGWEVINVSDGADLVVVFFKRPLAED